MFLLLFVQLALSQPVQKWLNAKIVADGETVDKVNVLNISNNITTMTSSQGNFKIPAEVGDALVISAVNLEIRRRIVSEEDLQTELLIIKMSAKMNQLNEVKVNEHSEINSENLRITARGQKRYTPAERKLRTATTGLIDPLLNRMSGRTAMLKKEVQVERNERLLLRLEGWYEDKYYTDVLKIPDDYIPGFQYYIIEDPEFARALVDKNKTLTMFYIKRLAVEYHEIIRQQEEFETD